MSPVLPAARRAVVAARRYRDEAAKRLQARQRLSTYFYLWQIEAAEDDLRSAEKEYAEAALVYHNEGGCKAATFY